MLVRIRPEDVEIGMFIHAFEGSWFDHPFWRRYFRVETQDQLQRIRRSGIDGIVIDDGRGLGAPEDRTAAEINEKPQSKHPPTSERAGDDAMPFRAAVLFAPPPSPARDAPRRRRGYAGECRRAKRAIGRTCEAVIDMFDAARLGRAVEVRRMVQLASAIGASIERDSKALINLVRLKEKDE
jgi:hypothetical protein